MPHFPPWVVTRPNLPHQSNSGSINNKVISMELADVVDLPAEMVQHLLAFTDTSTLIKVASKVSKAWREFSFELLKDRVARLWRDLPSPPSHSPLRTNGTTTN
jgi:hypothetical protein